METFRFIHCSDIHLGHAPNGSEERFRDIGETFARIVDKALEESVDLFLVAGDLFHKRNINAATLEQAMTQLARLKGAGIPVAAIEGNHDKAFWQDRQSWLEFLSRQGFLMLLRPDVEEGRYRLRPWDPDRREGAVVEVGPLRLIGLGYFGVTAGQRVRELAEEAPTADKFTVLLLHAGVDQLGGLDLGSLKGEDLAAWREKADYVALGHIHAVEEREDWLYTPGSPDWIHIGEIGREKGFFLVEVRGKEKTVTFLPSGHRPAYRWTLEIQGETPEEAAAAVKAEVDRRAREEPLTGAYLELTVTGTCPFSPRLLDSRALAEEVAQGHRAFQVDVVNSLNLPEGNRGTPGETVDRETLESQVLERLLAEQGVEGGDLADLARWMVRIKEQVALNQPLEGLAEGLLDWAGRRLDEMDAQALGETAAAEPDGTPCREEGVGA